MEHLVVFSYPMITSAASIVDHLPGPATRNGFSRVAVIGAGALGAYYGGRLSASGLRVSLLLRSAEWRDSVRRDGLRVDSVAGSFTAHPEVAASSTEMGPADLVVIGLKAFANDYLVELLAPILRASAPDYPAILTLQNGLGNEEAVANAVETVLGVDEGSRVPIAGGVAFICSNRMEPGRISHTAHGWIKAGWFRSGTNEKARAIEGAFVQAGVPCEWQQSLLSARFEKLVWNIPFNGLGVAAGASVSDILESAELLNATRQLMAEVVKTATACGCHLPVGVAEEMVQRSYAMGAYRSSMQLDYEAGRPLEVEAILGEPLRRARAVGVATTALQILYSVVRQRNLVRPGVELHAR